MRFITLFFILILSLLIVIFAFPREVEKYIDGFPHIINLLVAVGSISATFLALYFGFYGNYETRLAIKGKENELDLEAFDFLIHIHEMLSINRQRSRGERLEFINGFEQKILENAHLISEKKQRKLRVYTQLSKEYLEINNAETFSEIIKEAKLLEKGTIDSENQIQEMLEYHDFIFNKKNIYVITPTHQNDSQVLIYFEIDQNHSEVTTHVVEYVNNELNTNYSSNECERLGRIEYSFDRIDQNEKMVKIKIQGKVVKLKYKEPKQIRDLGLVFIRTRSQIERGGL